jgi:small subunit ribosomal protein S9
MPKISKKIKKKKEPQKPLKRKRKKVVKKKKAKVEKVIEKPQIEREKPEKYWQAVGRRKTSVARVRLFTRGRKEFLVNEKPYQEYFPGAELDQIASAALRKMKTLDKFRILIKVKGGGYHSQAEAVRHAISRALVQFNPNFRKRLKRAGYLTRDPRMRERKKFGLKRARRAPQWQKR